MAKQTYDIIRHYTNSLRQTECPEIRCCLAIGGVPVSESLAIINKLVFVIIANYTLDIFIFNISLIFYIIYRGVHIMVATPGRLMDMLHKKMVTLSVCRYLCMDEADRMIDMGFEEDVRTIFSFFRVMIISHFSHVNFHENCISCGKIKSCFLKK